MMSGKPLYEQTVQSSDKCVSLLAIIKTWMKLSDYIFLNDNSAIKIILLLILTHILYIKIRCIQVRKLLVNGR